MKKSTIAIVCSFVLNFALVLVVLFSSNPFWMQNDKAFLIQESTYETGEKGYIYSSFDPNNLQIGSYDCLLTTCAPGIKTQEPATILVYTEMINGKTVKRYELRGKVSGLHYGGTIGQV